MKTLENAKWRYATKKFDTTKKINNEDLEKLKDAVQLSASSYGLQLYKVLIIENKELREKLQPASLGQSQITEASHLFVLCNYNQVNDEHIDDFMKLKAETQGLKVEYLRGYGDFIKLKMSERTKEEQAIWTAKQTYIALGNLLEASAELHIDTCPMEGFEADKYDEILNLSEKGLEAAVVCAIGYRSEEDGTQHQTKVRKSKDDLFEVV